MEELNKQENKEIDHFEKVLTETGATWWGNTTKIGLYRQDLRAKLAIEFFNPSVGETIVDVGCGVGPFSIRIADCPAQITGFDITDLSINHAKELHKRDNLNFIVASVYEIPFSDNSIDYATGNAVLHHFDLDKAIPEIKRILKPGGKMIFFEPNMLNPHIFLEKNVRMVGKLFQNSEDEKAFYKNEIHNILLGYGFKDIKITPFDFMYPLLPGSLLEPIKILSNILEKTPVLKEFAGSLMISATK